MTSVLLLHIMMCLMIRILSTFMQVWESNAQNRTANSFDGLGDAV